MEPRLYLEGRG